MRIESVSSRLYRLPPTVRWEDSTHHVSALEFVVTDVETDTGLVGTGISYTTGVGGTAIVALVDDYCAGMLVGEDPLAIGRHWETLGKQLRRSGTGLAQLALSAVDTALWDLAGKDAERAASTGCSAAVATPFPSTAAGSTCSSTKTRCSPTSRSCSRSASTGSRSRSARRIPPRTPPAWRRSGG